jgi:hypothetical protein
MQVDLNMTRPRVFVNDTTFKTNDEGFKVAGSLSRQIIVYLESFQLHLVTYKSANTGRTEIACYIFMESETEQNVRDGVKAWKNIMPYNEIDIGGCIYIGVVIEICYRLIWINS